MRTVSRLATWSTGASGLLLLTWSLLVVRTDALAPLDAIFLRPAPDPHSTLGQIAAGVALITWPGLTYLGLGFVAYWAFRRRLKNLATAIIGAAALAETMSTVMKQVIQRPRPVDALDLITTTGFGYPSGHVSSMTMAMVIVAAATTVTRQSRRTIRLTRVVGAGAVVLVAWDRWYLHAHYLSDCVGGLLLGVFAATTALAVARVRMAPPPPPLKLEVPPRRCAVIVNPTKISDWHTMRRMVDFELTERGWASALWLETTVDDPGWAMTEQAVAAKVDLVLGAGGDGTIRAICSGLAHTGIPLGLLPAGTGNLLARNLGIPLDESEALAIAFDGRPRAIDLLAVTLDDATPEYVSILAGMGIDAESMKATNPELKKVMGTGAYVLAAVTSVIVPPFEATVTVGTQPPMTRRAGLVGVGNVGMLQAGMQLMPEAQPDDGLLDVLVASVDKPVDWPWVTAQIFSGVTDGKSVDRAQAESVTIETAEPVLCQLDGDIAGPCRRLAARVDRDALLVMTPIG